MVSLVHANARDRVSHQSRSRQLSMSPDKSELTDKSCIPNGHWRFWSSSETMKSCKSCRTSVNPVVWVLVCATWSEFKSDRCLCILGTILDNHHVFDEFDDSFKSTILPCRWNQPGYGPAQWASSSQSTRQGDLRGRWRWPVLFDHPQAVDWIGLPPQDEGVVYQQWRLAWVVVCLIALLTCCADHSMPLLVPRPEEGHNFGDLKGVLNRYKANHPGVAVHSWSTLRGQPFVSSWIIFLCQRSCITDSCGVVLHNWYMD